jgi:hypothetical protein
MGLTWIVAATVLLGVPAVLIGTVYGGVRLVRWARRDPDRAEGVEDALDYKSLLDDD